MKIIAGDYYGDEDEIEAEKRELKEYLQEIKADDWDNNDELFEE